MKTYQFESVVNESGVIVLPDEMKNLHKHRVKLIIVDLETESSKTSDFLDKITKEFSDIRETDLDIAEVYQARGNIDERQIVFD